MQDRLILYIDNNFYSKLELWEALGDQFTIHTLTNGLEAYKWLLEGNKPDVILCEYFLPGYNGLNLLSNLKNNKKTQDIPFILVGEKEISMANIREARSLGASDVYFKPLPFDRLKLRIETLIDVKELKQNEKKNTSPKGNGFNLTQGIEVVLASITLFLLSPVYLITSLILKLNSRGPVLSITPTIGKGFQKFNNYKFRVMHWQKTWEGLSYIAPSDDTFKMNDCPNCQSKGSFCSPLLYIGGISICENLYQSRKTNTDYSEAGINSLTSFGKILRKTGLEGLPNLINIIKGEMSFIGAKPLTPETAEKYTTDENTGRFLVHAGMVNLWKNASKKLFKETTLNIEENRVLIKG